MGLAVSLASRGAKLTFEGPHWDLTTSDVNSQPFLHLLLLVPFPSSPHIQRAPVVRQVGHVALRYNGNSEHLGKINRLMQMV